MQFVIVLRWHCHWMIPKITIWEICVINNFLRVLQSNYMSILRRSFFLCFYSTTILLNYTCINYFYGIAEQLYEQFTQVFFCFCLVLSCFVLFCFVLFCFVLFCFVFLFIFIFIFLLFLFFCRTTINYGQFTDGIIDFRFVTAQLYEQFTQVGSIVGIVHL